MRELVSRLVLDLFQANDHGFLVIAAFLMVVEAVMTSFVIERVPYTEIDWSTYMQQVECYLKKGTLNYTQIGGNTGPVVYPAGHIFIYRILYALTDSGKSIRTAQYIFQVFYLLNLFFVFRILYKTHRIPPIVLFLVTVTGYRIHSIFVLRLFNDPVTMLLFYAALDQFLDQKWMLGCVIYSLAVSIKMNVLLFAPALFFTLLLNTGLFPTMGYIAACAAVQLYIGGPFLIYDWKAYVTRSFDLGRVFMFKWTVNWRFLPEELFLDKRFHIALLVGHLTVLAIFAGVMWFRPLNGLAPSISLVLFRGITTSTDPADVLYAFFTSNLIGIAFSRSLHYQFYSWYFHQLPFLLFSNYPHITSVLEIPWRSYVWKVFVLLAVEVSWNIYPSTNWSSALLHLCHVIILWYLIATRPQKPQDSVTQGTLKRVQKRVEAIKKVLDEEGHLVPRSWGEDEDDNEESDKEEEDSEESEDESEKTEEKDREHAQKLYKMLKSGQKIPAAYEDQEEMNEAFEEYWNQELKTLRDAHQVYVTNDGTREVTGLPPIGDGGELKPIEELKRIYAEALHIQKQAKEEAAEKLTNQQRRKEASQRLPMNREESGDSDAPEDHTPDASAESSAFDASAESAALDASEVVRQGVPRKRVSARRAD